ncbi:VanZ family protein [Lactiplantibacillus fabifermentans]|nr:VanZ family protein [Lactiplantibacillus fabifermentans]ETY73064.1 membrane protein [Lactiplantibacillus fabifermentans T30PCM01]
MLSWLPFILLSCLFVYLIVQIWHQSLGRWERLKEFCLLMFIWVLTAFCYTPTAYNFSGTVITDYIQWGPVKMTLIPFQHLDTEFWLNILLTVPFGFLLAWNYPHVPWRRTILLGLITGLTLECGQFVLDWLVNIGRWVEVDDVLTNCAGVIVGFIIFRGLSRMPGWRWLTR